MILPYVYKLTHKETGHFYIGYRCKNVSLNIKSSEDIGVCYFTSSKLINSKNIIDYQVEVIAEFFNSNDAYDFEQELIRDSWDSELLINDHYHKDGVGRWKNPGHTAETRKKLSEVKKGRKRSIESRTKQSESTKGRRFSDSHKANLSISKKGNKNPMFGNEPANKKYFTESVLAEKVSEWRNTSYKNRKERCYRLNADINGKIPKAKRSYQLPDGSLWYKDWIYELAPAEFSEYISSQNLQWESLEVK